MWRIWAMVVVLALGLATSATHLLAAGQDRILVFAAASLRDALLAAADSYRREDERPVVFSFASSGVLAKQIAAGAPADLFISADDNWVNWLAHTNPGRVRARIPVAGNRLIVARNGTAQKADSAEAALAGGRFAMGDPNHVPAGRYGRQALKKAGLWTRLRDRAIFGENVRVALAHVRSGAVASAIVYASDLMVFDDLVEAFRFDDESHFPIVYPAVVLDSPGDGGRSFLAYLTGDGGQTILTAHGFTIPKP